MPGVGGVLAVFLGIAVVVGDIGGPVGPWIDLEAALDCGFKTVGAANPFVDFR